MAAVSVIIFDKNNKQQNYQSIARNMDGELVIGWIVIEQPWYSPETNWTYWMYSNEYSPGGLCGGATDLGLTRCIVDKNIPLFIGEGREYIESLIQCEEE